MVANANVRVIGHCDCVVILSILHCAETLGKGVYAAFSLTEYVIRKATQFQYDRNEKGPGKPGPFQRMVGVARIELATPTMST